MSQTYSDTSILVDVTDYAYGDCTLREGASKSLHHPSEDKRWPRREVRIVSSM